MPPEIDKDGPYFAYRAETAIKIIKALQAAREISYCLEAVLPRLVSPDLPPNHPLYELKVRSEKALAAWKEGAGI